MVLFVSAIADAISAAEVKVACLMIDSFRGLGAQAEGRLDWVVSGEYRGSPFVRHATVEGKETEAEGLGA